MLQRWNPSLLNHIMWHGWCHIWLYTEGVRTVHNPSFWASLMLCAIWNQKALLSGPEETADPVYANTSILVCGWRTSVLDRQTSEIDWYRTGVTCWTDLQSWRLSHRRFPASGIDCIYSHLLRLLFVKSIINSKSRKTYKWAAAFRE